MKKKIRTEDERLKALTAKVELIKSGNAGIDRMGNVVDLRDNPKAVKIQDRP